MSSIAAKYVATLPWRTVMRSFTYDRNPDPRPLVIGNSTWMLYETTLVEELQCGHYNEVWPMPEKPGQRRRCWQCAREREGAAAPGGTIGTIEKAER